MQKSTESTAQSNNPSPDGGIPAACAPARDCHQASRTVQPNGGQTTISPPAKISSGDTDDFKVVASGIDTLVLAIDITWNDDNIFPYLGELKEKAKSENEDAVGKIKVKDAGEWPFQIKPHGVKGYEWLLSGNGFTLRIGNWLVPNSRPSVIAEIRSQALWEISPQGTIIFLKALLESAGARLMLMKPSRVDLCLDLLVPKEFWVPDLMSYRVTRASDAATYYHHHDMTGLGIGRGKISARLYDKPLEIRQKSKKFWMYDIWKLDEVPEGKKIIRVEFQLRREALKELSLETIIDLFKLLGNIWAHCSQKWLKFRDRPGMQSHQRKTLQFWHVVQNGFTGAQGSEPLVRVRALAASKKQLAQQAMGLLTSVMAVQHEENDMKPDHRATLIGTLDALFRESRKTDDFEQEFAESVLKKRAKHHRILLKSEEGYELRSELGFPVGNKHIKRKKDKRWTI